MSESLREFKDSLAKYSAGTLLHIAEAAEILKVTEKYLTDQAIHGKIKAYKAGEHWFLEEKWLHDFRSSMKEILDVEIADHHFNRNHHHGWSRQLAPRRFRVPQIRVPQISIPQINFKPFVILSFQTVAAAVALTFLTAGFSFLCLPLAQVGLNRVALADNFLNATFNIYSLPLAYASNMSWQGPIDDEKLTHAIYRLAGKNPPGQVAGAYEKVEIR